MELRIHPEELRAAAAALIATATQLEVAAHDFERVAAPNAVDLGLRSMEVASRGITATCRASGAFAIDLRRLAHALAALADHYPRVDNTALPPR
jgi:hypothetical protein